MKSRCSIMSPWRPVDYEKCYSPSDTTPVSWLCFRVLKSHESFSFTILWVCAQCIGDIYPQSVMFLWINLFHERRIKTYRGCVESTEPSGVTSSSLVFLFHPVGRWAFFGGDAGSVRLHSVQFREGHLSHGCPPAKHDTGQGEIQAGGHTHRSLTRGRRIPSTMLLAVLCCCLCLYRIKCLRICLLGRRKTTHLLMI